MSTLIPLVLAAGLAGPPAAAAQDLSWKDGVLGSTLAYALKATPGQLWILGLSKTEGPIPLALIDGADPRLLFLGLDLIQIWKSGTVPVGGEVSLVYPLPPDASVVGLKVHAQGLTLPGTTTLVDKLSNTVALRLQLSGTSVPTVGKRPDPGSGHTQTPLPDGRVLLVGGADPAGALLSTHEIFLPQAQVFLQSPPLAAARVDHTGTALFDGRVLVAGGRELAGATATCLLIDGASGTAASAAPLLSPRSRHTATRLSDGRVLVVGGLAVDDPADVVATLLSAHAATALYDPVLDAWSAGPSLANGLIGHAAVLLPDGRVLVTGGYELGSLFGFPTQVLTAAAWLIDPVLGTVAPAAPLPQAIARHASIVPAADGRAVVLGGERIEPFYLLVYVAGVHRYDASADAWTTLAPLAKPRGYHAVVEAGGKIVVVGGISALDSMTLIETAEATAEAAPGDLSGWGAPIALTAGRHRVRATAYDGGVRVLVTGGPLDAAPAPTAEIVMP
jgi:hypothetical protein